MTQRLQDTDAFILREFDDATRHLKTWKRGPALAQEMQRLGQPFYDRLRANGHEPVDAIGLLRAVFEDRG